MAVHTSAQFQELLFVGMKKIYDQQIGKLRDYLPLIYNMDRSTKAQETTLGMGGMPMMGKWQGTVTYRHFRKGFRKDYIHVKYDTGLEIERELWDDDQYGEIKKRVRNLAYSVWYTRQVHGASIFNFAFTDAGNTDLDDVSIGADGKPLCAPDHPLYPGAGPGETYSNFDTLELTEENVEKVYQKMTSWRDDQGNLIPVNPDTLIVPTALRKTALIIAGSEQRPGTDYNDINIYKGNLNVIVWPFLKDPTAWFLADSARMKNFLNWFDRRKPVLERDEDFDTEALKAKVVGRWSLGWDDPRFVFGCKPATP